MTQEQPYGPQPVPPPGGPGGYLQPHRGTLILVLGIISLVVPCGGLILGIIAWVMGSTDLRAMREGRMDRSGEGLTNAGRICGIIAVILWIIGTIMCTLGAMFFMWRGPMYYR